MRNIEIKKKKICTKRGGSKCVSLGPLKIGWPNGDQIFQKIKDLIHIDMMNYLIPNTYQFYKPKLHQSVMLQGLKVRVFFLFL